MKKLLSLLALGFSLILLASCSNKDTLSGKYYDIYDGEAKLVFEFTDNGGKFYKEGSHAVTDIDTKNNTFTFSDNGKDYVVAYEQKNDGSMDYDMGNYLTGSNKDTAYKEGSEAYKEAMK
ncbi:DUF4968 domain-containing protein [Streptococcus uberis]|uniref:hypothetical protein n=1 Tax=Streptococcus uberis TaxID=1349 RepID=UPI0027DE3BAB|nr:hypothetical protein [Streptococcus uberis]MCK1238886.1 DUF4968 domain-containing protein [Streptococcus uberis]